MTVIGRLTPRGKGCLSEKWKKSIEKMDKDSEKASIKLDQERASEQGSRDSCQTPLGD